MSQAVSDRPQVGLSQIPVQRLVAALAVVALGSNFLLPVGRVSVGLIVAAALAPVTIPAARRFSWVTTLLTVSALCVVLGFWLALRPGLREMDTGRVREALFLLALLVLGTCLIVWARTLIPDPWVAFLYGVGLFIGISPNAAFYFNPWKFGFAIPITVLALSVAWGMGSRKLELVFLLALAGESALKDSRSSAGLLVVAALLLLWSARRRRVVRRRWFGPLLLVLLAMLAIYKVGETLILDGYLGETTQVRSQAQVDSSGSLILGGRPELGATVVLMKAHPMGFGVGVAPSLPDIRLAKEGMAAIGYDPDNNYVDKYMFGSKFELHSSAADLWAAYGLLGLALSGVLLVITMSGLARIIAHSTAHALVLLLGVRLAWDLAFSPIGTSVQTWVLFLGLIVLPRAARPRGASVQAAPEPVSATP